MFAVLTAAPLVVLGFQHGWLPYGPKLLHAGLFVLLGMRLRRSPALLAAVVRHWNASLAAAVICFACLLPRIWSVLHDGRGDRTDAELGLLLTGFALAATAGHLGAALRWLDRPTPLLTRLAAASFWIYLVHHPVVGLTQLALRAVPLPPAVKFSLAAVGTTLFCVWSYERFVAGRAIGRLLEGDDPREVWRDRRKKPKTPATSPVPGIAPVPARKAA